MIPANVRIKGYLLINHRAEGFGMVKPKEDEEFWGIPHAWHNDDSTPYIEVTNSGKLIRTVNASDVSEIEFE